MKIPKDTEAEKAVLGAIIEDNEILDSILPILSANSFYNGEHKHIYSSMLELLKQHKPIDELIIGDELKKSGYYAEVGGLGYLAELVDSVPSNGNIVYYAKIIQEHSICRDLINVSNNIINKASDPQQSVNKLLIEIQEKVSKISEIRTNNNIVHIKDIMVEAVEETERRSKEKNDTIGLPTGLKDLDSMISGLIAPDVILIAARPAMGKSALALNIVENLYKLKGTKKATLIFSREMSNIQNGNRLLSSACRIEGRKLKTGKLDAHEFDKLYQSAGDISEYPIYLDDRSKSMDEIEHAVRVTNKKHEIGLIVIDYLQLIKGKTDRNREQEISDISRRTKILAKDYNIPIIALSQLNRELEKRSDKRPLLSDLRESGALEQDADIILFIYRDEEYNKNSKDKGIAEILIRKHRNGKTGVIKLGFQGQYTKFVDYRY